MRRSTIAAGVVVAVVVAGAGGLFSYRRSQEAAQDRDAQAALTAFAAAWSAGDVSGIGFVDASAAAGLSELSKALGGATASVQPAAATRTEGQVTASAKVSWDLPGETDWTYEMPLNAVQQGDRWLIEARGDRLWHPDLATGDTVEMRRVVPARGELRDRRGEPLMPMGDVYPVQIDPSVATEATVRTLETLVEADPGTLLSKWRAAKKAGSRAPIPVITYRDADFVQRQEALDALKGVIYPRSQAPLAPTREFGQPLLGSFGSVTAEVIERSGGRYVAGDRAGLSGLQGAYDEVLAGRPGLVLTANLSGETLFTQPAEAGTDVDTSLDPKVQLAAEAALKGTGEVPSALVAVDVTTGGVLAVANAPSFGFNRALSGRFPPGSAFKVATSYSLLQQGLVTPGEKVPCPGELTVDGKVFRNFEGGELAGATFADDVRTSCNTAFVSLAPRLKDGDLQAAGRALGLGAGWGEAFGVAETFDGSIPVNTGVVDKAAAMIGQGRDLASPLALATMVSSVARGAYLPPVLITNPAPSGAADRTPVPLDAAALEQLRPLLRAVVTSGSGQVLASVPGEAVSGKTGTAEYGAEVPPKTHAWFVGWQGEVAFAVLVEDGRSGGSVAAPIAKEFLTRLAAAG